MHTPVRIFALRTFLFCLLTSVFCASPARAFNSHAPFDISADIIDYVDADQSMTAEGHVVVVQGTSTLKADHMRYERVTQRLFAQGHILMTDNGATMLGDTLNYDLKNESGTVTSALSYQSPWIFSGASWQKEMDYLIGRQTTFTSCDLTDPHYHLRSSRVHLIPNEHFWAWNNLTYVDTLPVFYTPFVYRNLADRKVVMQFQPGHDEVNGNFLKTITTIRFAPLIYDKVLFDHYSKQGNGLGNEFDYQVPGKMQGSLFGYYINPHDNQDLSGAPDQPQYNIRSYHWQQLDHTTTLQSNVNLRQNISFNNQYFAQDTNQSVNDITSSVALTKQTTHVNQHLVVEQVAAPDSGDTSAFAATHVQTASLPRYDVALLQIPLWNSNKVQTSSTTNAQLMLGPWLSSSAYLTRGNSGIPIKPSNSSGKLGPIMLDANGNVGQTYQRLDGLMHNNANGAFTLSEAIPLTRNWSFTPNITPSVRWQDKFDAQPPPPAGSTTPVSTAGLFRGYQGRLGTADTLRWRMSSSLTLDQTYSLTARMEPNGTALDRALTDGGIETHHLSWLAFWRPSRNILMRSFSGYDMRKIADETLLTYQQRKWDPWTSELTLQATKRSDFFLRYQMGEYPNRTLLWEGDYRFLGPYKSRVETGLLYNKGSPGLLTWNNGLGLFLSPGWRVDATVHALLPSTSLDAALREGNLIDSEFIVTRDLHCWETQFIYRNRPPFIREYSILFNLKLGVKAKEEITNSQLETQYYPWRSQAYAQ